MFRFTRIFVAVGLLAAVWLLVTSRRPGTRPPAAAAPGRVKILQFYASTGVVARGDKALLCYGVENARAIKLSPPVDGLTPALSRCFEVAPEHTTHYTLLAEGYDGIVVTQSFTLSVQAAPPPPPQILHFVAQPAGRDSARICYRVVNATRIALAPGADQTSTDPEGCFTVTPRRTTTYTLTAFGHGAEQRARRQIVVEVPDAAKL